MQFTKMHGLGNDFILVDGHEDDLSDIAIALCPRRTSVGADGVIAILPTDKADARMEIANADGSIAEMCGNGIRCFARYVYDKGLVKKPEMSVETRAGIMYPALILHDGKVEAVRVNMGKPDFTPENIPVTVPDPLQFSIDLDGAIVPASVVRMGVPHAVLYVNDISEETLAQLGRAIEQHSLFPEHTNVNFVEVLDDSTLRVRTWERGAGRTMACGTGSCASAVISQRKGLTGGNVTVVLDSGNLNIETEEDGTVYMTGPAEYVYEAATLPGDERSA